MPPKRSKVKDLFIHQAFMNERYPIVALKIVPEGCMDDSQLDWLLEDKSDATDTSIQLVAMQPSYTKAGLLAALAVCISHKVLIVTDIMKSSSSQRRAAPSRRGLYFKFLSSTSGFSVVAFNAHELVLALHRDMGLVCARVVDLLSLPPRNRDVVQTVKNVTRARLELFEDVIREAFQTNVFEKSQHIPAQQAWFAWTIGNLPEAQKELAGIPVIDSSAFTKTQLDFLAKGMEGLLLRDIQKPISETLAVPSGTVMYEGNKVSLNQQAYGSRLRNAPHQVLKVDMQRQVILSGTVASIQGKRAILRIPDLDGFIDPRIQSLTVMGRALPTQADRQHALTILSILQGKLPLFDDPWINILFPPSAAANTSSTENASKEAHTSTSKNLGWAPADECSSSAVSTASQTADVSQEDDGRWAAAENDPWISAADTSVSQTQESAAGTWDVIPSGEDPWTLKASHYSDEPSSTLNPQHSLPIQNLVFNGVLNPSQIQAVRDMLDLNKRVSIIKGPPGTGKTTVIAAYVAEILSQVRKPVLVIAQSNVAIKNVSEKLFNSGISDWVLLVSSEFLSGWHEHLYEQLPQSNLLPSSDMNCPIHARTVLCTLSMLGNSKFIQLTKRLHVEYVVVEEASQIPMNSFLPLVAKFGKKMKKMSFIGDDMQLPPYASEGVDSLLSVFENKPLLKGLHISLLEVQYRMPPAIGDFISKEVYSSLLKSWDAHPIKSPLCVQFLDIDSAEEPDKDSFKNSLEASAAISIATLLNQTQKTYKIITPYEAQRNLLEQRLKDSGLTWMNTCFTVDSFQGNEGDYIILSIVRTNSVGFLQDIRRTNVMLSRAKKGMFICSKQSFLKSPGARHTLVGKMAEEWAAIEGGWIRNHEELHIE